jgi:hypothetical protein
MTPVPPHRVRLPDPSGLFKKLDKEDRAFMVELIAALQRELDQRVPSTAARPEMLVFSPDGSTWSLTVSDAGIPVAWRASAP